MCSLLHLIGCEAVFVVYNSVVRRFDATLETSVCLKIEVKVKSEYMLGLMRKSSGNYSLHPCNSFVNHSPRPRVSISVRVLGICRKKSMTGMVKLLSSTENTS